MNLAVFSAGISTSLLRSDSGDTFNVVFEEQYIDCEFVGYGEHRSSGVYQPRRAF